MIPVELTEAEAVAVANALFMCLRPNNVRPPFAAVANIEAMESGYRKITGPVSELQGLSCSRCGRPWDGTAGPWDSFGDPETGDTDLVCPNCITPEEQAFWDEHHERFVHYAKKLYSTPSWKGAPSHP
ncbi:MAG: hypothetical protein ACRDNX_09265 [Gaiellaceae bacterium]